MTLKQQDIAQKIMEGLSEWDEPAAEAVVFSYVATRLPRRLLLSEFVEVMKELESARLITGVIDDFQTIRWTLTNKGRASLSK